jgi:mRNA interferase MazF
LKPRSAMGWLMTATPFRRGDVWVVDFVPARGHEQDGRRPAVILSIDAFSNGPAGLLLVAPLTRTNRGIAYHVEVRSPEGGLRDTSFIMCDQIVTVAHARALRHCGSLSADTMTIVADRIRILIGL